MSQDAFAQFAAVLPLPVLLVTADGRVRYANPPAREELPLPRPLNERCVRCEPAGCFLRACAAADDAPARGVVPHALFFCKDIL